MALKSKHIMQIVRKIKDRYKGTHAMTKFIWVDMQSFLVALSSFINKTKYLNQLQKAFLVCWLPSVNIQCTNCTALGTLSTYVQGVFWLWHHKELKYHEYQGRKI